LSDITIRDTTVIHSKQLSAFFEKSYKVAKTDRSKLQI